MNELHLLSHAVVLVKKKKQLCCLMQQTSTAHQLKDSPTVFTPACQMCSGS